MPIKRDYRPYSKMRLHRIFSFTLDKKSAKRIVIWTGMALAGIFASGVLVLSIALAIISRDLPDPNSLITRQVDQSTKIFDRTGTVLLYEIHGNENRTLIQTKDLPSYVPHASVAIEDKNFYQHHGVSVTGLVRAVFSSVIQGKRIQGTSTITQQLIKNAILTNERSIVRKLKEILLSLQLEREFNKDQILQMYLNEIPYGSNIYGIESAAHSYFGKTAKELTLDEAALLASIPQAPDIYSPYGTGSRGDNRELLVQRQRYVLTQMSEQGYITKEQSEEAKNIETLKKIVPKKIGDIKAPHFVMYIRSLLEEKYGQANVETKGYKVITTLDWEKQQIAEEEIIKGVETRGKKYAFTNASLISLDPKNGQILAMVGSKDFFDNEHDGQVNVTLRPRQPGSSFKPIVYAAAFAKGYTPETTLWDVNTVFKTDSGQNYEPKNYDLKEHGPVTIRQALQGSLNIPAVKALYLVGVGRVLDFAQKLGYTTLDQRSRFGLSLVLGGGEVTLLEHTNAYAAFAAEGEQYPVTAILKVEDPQGTVIEEWKKPNASRVIDVDSTLRITDVLSDNAARAYVFGDKNFLTLPNRPVAAKTGTTNNYHDAWTVGYTPSLVTGVWVGNNDNKEMKRGADGSQIAAPIWQGYMKRALENIKVESFTPPPPNDAEKPVLQGKAETVTINIDMSTGLPATAETPAFRIQQFVYHGEAHTILYYLDKDDPRGPAPSEPNQDPQFKNWENAIQDWVTRTGWNTTSTIPAEYLYFQNPTEPPVISILQPTMNETWTNHTGTFALSTSSSRPIIKIEAFLKDILVGELSDSTLLMPIQLPTNIEKGFHDIVVTATDSLGNKGNTTVTLNILAEPIVPSTE